MTIKKVVAIALPIGLFIAGTIILFGLFEAKLFAFLYFLFVALTLMTIIISAGFQKSDLVFMLVASLIFTAALGLFAFGAKTYHQSAQNQNIADLNEIISTNNYYSDYVDFLNAQIEEYKAQSVVLNAQLVTQQNPQTTSPLRQIQDDDEELERRFEGDEYDDDD